MGDQETPGTLPAVTNKCQVEPRERRTSERWGRSLGRAHRAIDDMGMAWQVVAWQPSSRCITSSAVKLHLSLGGPMHVATILDQIDLGAMALPSFQRGYV